MRIIVASQKEKDDLIAASRHIHDSSDIDTSIDMVNILAHLYLKEDLVEIDRNSQSRPNKYAVFEREPSRGSSHNGVIFGPYITREQAEHDRQRWCRDDDNCFVSEYIPKK